MLTLLKNKAIFIRDKIINLLCYMYVNDNVKFNVSQFLAKITAELFFKYILQNII